MSHVLFVAVSYKTDELAIDFLRQFSSVLEAGHARVVIVDNSASSSLGGGVCPRVDKDVPGALCVAPDSNLGYFGGAQYGLDHVLAGDQTPEWVVISNVDLVFNPMQLVSALRELEQDTTIGVVAPRIMLEKYPVDLNPFMTRRPNDLRMRFQRSVFQWYWLYVIYSTIAELRKHIVHRFGRRQGKPQASGRVYAPHGAIMVFHRRFFSNGGSLSDASFLFGEEIFVAEECRRLGLAVVYRPEIAVTHISGASMSLVKSRQIHYYERAATRAFVDRYF